MIGRIERAARRRRRPRPDFDEACALARRQSRLRTDRRSPTWWCERLAQWSVHRTGTPPLRTMSACLARRPWFMPNLMDMGNVRRDAGLAPIRAASWSHCFTLRPDALMAAPTRSERHHR